MYQKTKVNQLDTQQGDLTGNDVKYLKTIKITKTLDVIHIPHDLSLIV